MNIIRNSLIVSLLVVLVMPTSFAFAAGIEDVKGVNYAHCESNEFAQANSVSFSGDDLYDSAASLSGSEVDHVTSFPWEVAISFTCTEASADFESFSANPELAWAQGNFSGDDAYDPAVLEVPGSSEDLIGGSYSGDDDYDLAVGAVL